MRMTISSVVRPSSLVVGVVAGWAVGGVTTPFAGIVDRVKSPEPRTHLNIVDPPLEKL